MWSITNMKKLLVIFSLLSLAACSNVDRDDPAKLTGVAWINGPYMSSPASSSSEALSSGTVSSSSAVITSITDRRDGQVYQTMQLGGLTWMAQNLNYEDPVSNSWCYDNDTLNCRTYGRLYTYEAALEACPSSWHLADTTDWARLTLFAGTAPLAGELLKSTEKELWGVLGAGKDLYAFDALPSGQVIDAVFSQLGNTALWWTATEVSTDDSRAYVRIIVADKKSLNSNTADKDQGLAVRCVEDK